MQAAAAQIVQTAPTVQTVQTAPQSTNVLARDDTFLGVCEALGEDFGFNPLWLRIALGVAVLWNPLWALAAYAGLGTIVAAARWIAPKPRRAAAAEPTAPAAPVTGDNDAIAEVLAAAA
jgi:phage shock protein C